MLTREYKLISNKHLVFLIAIFFKSHVGITVWHIFPIFAAIIFFYTEKRVKSCAYQRNGIGYCLFVSLFIDATNWLLKIHHCISRMFFAKIPCALFLDRFAFRLHPTIY